MRIMMRLVMALSLLLTALPAGGADYQIINGEPAAVGEYPAMAALIDADFGQFCGGTLIDPEWVLTAAHCFYDARTGGSSVAPDVLEVAVDTVDWTQGGERLGVSQIILHPQYDDFTTVNDVALLRLSAPAATPPAPLVTADRADLYGPGRTGTVTGYGVTNDGEGSQLLLEVDVPLVADADCRPYYGDLVDDRHTCAGALGGQGSPGPDTCQGDSGGPLFTDRGDGVLAVIGITSFGLGCGEEAPGVYTEVITYLSWVAGTLDGSIPPDTPVDPTVPPLPEGAATEPVRITHDDSTSSDPVLQAVAISQQAFFEGSAPFGVIATSSRYPDALAGSTLAYGLSPMLFSGPDGTLSEATLDELRRAVQPGADVFVLGGVAAVPPVVDEQLTAAGFTPVRLAGPGREWTATAVAQQVLARFNGQLPLDTVIIATSGNWPDAITVGQIGSWWGTPVLLTPGEALHPETSAALQQLAPSRVLVAGGVDAISDATAAEIESITGAGSVVRLGGPTRFETAAAVASFDIVELFGPFPPQYLVVVNLRREADAFAHVLAASMLTGAYGGVFVPVEGDSGTDVPSAVLDSICGLDLPVLVAGGADLVSEDAVVTVQDASAGLGCDPTADITLGDAVFSTLTDTLPSRTFALEGVAGQTVRIRMDAPPSEEAGVMDPFLRLYGPDGSLVEQNDDGPEGTLNAMVEVTLPATGTYLIETSSVSDAGGRFVLTADPAPVGADGGTLSADQPEVGYPLQTDPGVRVVVEMRTTDAGLDPLLFVVDSASGEVIAFDDNGGGFPNARLTFTSSGGPLEVVAGGFEESAGSYALAVYAPDGGVIFG